MLSSRSRCRVGYGERSCSANFVLERLGKLVVGWNWPLAVRRPGAVFPGASATSRNSCSRGNRSGCTGGSAGSLSIVGIRVGQRLQLVISIASKLGIARSHTTSGSASDVHGWQTGTGSADHGLFQPGTVLAMMTRCRLGGRGVHILDSLLIKRRRLNGRQSQMYALLRSLIRAPSGLRHDRGHISIQRTKSHIRKLICNNCIISDWKHRY